MGFGRHTQLPLRDLAQAEGAKLSVSYLTLQYR